MCVYRSISLTAKLIWLYYCSEVFNRFRKDFNYFGGDKISKYTCYIPKFKTKIRCYTVYILYSIYLIIIPNGIKSRLLHQYLI